MPSPNRDQPAKARSNYRQVRLTFTAEIGGMLSYSIYAKPLNAQWNEHHVLVRDHLSNCPMPETTEDVFRILIRILDDNLLPGIG